MKWIGLTGGIGTGKSTVKKLIEGLGFPVIDADLISHQLTQIGQEGYKNIVSQFGNDLLNPDQTLNRKYLAEIIFSDPEQRTRLEAILHPLIQADVIKQKKFHEDANRTLCFYDVPLLFEKDMQKHFDVVILVWADPVLQRLRLATRNSLTEVEIQKRLDSQLPMSVKIKNSQYCLDNSTDLVGLEKQVRSLVQTLG